MSQELFESAGADMSRLFNDTTKTNGGSMKASDSLKRKLLDIR